MARFQVQTESFGDFNHACDVISDRFPEALCDSAEASPEGHTSGIVWVDDTHLETARKVLQEVASNVEVVG